jgi:hypothetical protein
MSLPLGDRHAKKDFELLVNYLDRADLRSRYISPLPRSFEDRNSSKIISQKYAGDSLSQFSEGKLRLTS